MVLRALPYGWLLRDCYGKRSITGNVLVSACGLQTGLLQPVLVFVSMKGVLRLYEAYTALHGHVVFLRMRTLFVCMGRIRRLRRVSAKTWYCTVFFVKNIDLSGFL